MKKEIILVGSGLTACTLAWKLHTRNISFIWFADHFPAASHAAYGILNPIHFRNASKSWKEDYFYQAAYDFYLNLNNQLPQLIARQTSIYHFINDAKEAVYFRQQAECGELGHYCDGDTHFLDQPCIQESKIGGALIQHALHVQIPEYVRQTIEYFTKKNCVIHKHLEPNLIELFENTVQYENITAQHIIFCEGKYIEENPFFNYVPLNLSKGEVIQIKTQDTLPNVALHKKVFILEQSKNKYIVGATTAWDDATLTPTESAKNELSEDARSILLTHFEITDQRCGIRPAMADRRPIIGKHPLLNTLCVLNGMGSKGLFYAPQSADLLLDHLFKNADIPFDISIRRFDRKYRTWLETQRKKAPPTKK